LGWEHCIITGASVTLDPTSNDFLTSKELSWLNDLLLV